MIIWQALRNFFYSPTKTSSGSSKMYTSFSFSVFVKIQLNVFIMLPSFGSNTYSVGRKSRIFPPGVEACMDAVGKQDGDNAENGGKS